MKIQILKGKGGCYGNTGCQAGGTTLERYLTKESTYQKEIIEFCELVYTDLKNSIISFGYSVVSIKRTGSLNYFEVFYHPELFFHVINEFFLPP